MTLCAISVERWYAICHPLKFHSTVQRARIIIIVIWSIAVSVALPEGISAIVVVYGENGTTQSMCYPGMLTENQIQILQIFLMITFYFIPLCLMGYMYISIAIVLSKKRIPGINYKGKAAHRHSSLLRFRVLDLCFILRVSSSFVKPV